jgi:glutamine synthetase
MSQTNILLDNNFQFVSYKYIDILGRTTQKEVSFKQFCNSKNEPEYYRYFADSFRSLPTLNVFTISESHKIASQVQSLLRIKKIDLSIQLSIDFFIDNNKILNKKQTERPRIDHEFLSQDLAFLNLSDPVDEFSNLRAEIASQLENIGIEVYEHSAKEYKGQCQIKLEYSDFITAADNFIVAKHIIKNVVASYGKTATFMPKPIIDMMSNLNTKIVLDAVNARNFVSGITKNIQALNAFTNPTQNSFKKLKIHPEISNINMMEIDKNIYEIELKFLDCIGNIHAALSAIILAGLSGNSKNKESTLNKDLINLKFSKSLENSLELIKTDLDFCHNIFHASFIDNYIDKIKENEKCDSFYINPSEIIVCYNM